MSRMKDIKLSGTTDASTQAATVNGPSAILGRLYAIYWDIGTCASGAVDVTITMQGGSHAKTLLTLSNSSASTLYYVRDLLHGETGSALTGTSGGDRELPLLDGTPRVVIAQGGASKTFAVTLFYYD